MAHIRNFLVALLLIAGISPVLAQQFPTVPTGTVIGRTQAGTGPAQAIPFSSIQAATLPNSSVTNAKLVTGPANTVKGSVNGTTTSDLAIASCSALYQFTQWVSGTGWQCGLIPVLPSRATAATLDLSAFTSVTTLGYATPGDGGGATFKNVTSNPVIDSFVTAYSTAAGSGYTNGSYNGVVMSNANKPVLVGSAVVSGNVITTTNFVNTPGGLCKIGDNYTSASGVPPGGTGFSITTTACSTPRGSFTDSASNHWQIVYDGDSPNIKQFGAVGDWSGTDASATDNYNALQAALWFTGNMNGQNLTSGNGGFWGGRLWVPQGTFMSSCSISTSLIVPFGVVLEGASNQGSVIRMCDTFTSTSHFVALCDPNWHTACFNALLRNIQLSARTSVSSSSAYMVYSNSTQDFGGLDNVYIYGGTRGCVHLEKGFGGASTAFINKLSCTALSTLPQVWMGNTTGSGFNFGSTIESLRDIVLGGPSGGGTYQTGPGILLNGGFPRVENVHCENMAICIQVDTPSGTGNNDLVSITNVNSASTGAPAPACTSVVQLTAANNPSNALMNQIPIGGCTNTISNLQGGTNNMTTNVYKPVTCPSAGACS